MELTYLRKPTPPHWVQAWMGQAPGADAFATVRDDWGSELRGTCTQAGGLTLVNLTIREARSLDDERFARQVIAAYRKAADLLGDSQANHPVRWWNYLPDIRQRTANGLNRYMHFNAGRYAALAEGQTDPPAQSQLATASAVGHSGPEFTVHVLAANRPGTPIENPRQVPAYQYSADYGPKPPCFARATALHQPPFNPDHHDERRELDGRVLIGGTASVLGQRSAHVDDLPAQFDETCRNLASLIAHAGGQDSVEADCAALDLISSMRVYVVRPNDERWIVEAIKRRFTRLEHLEVMHAPLCREDLLVEIEGITQANVYHKPNPPSVGPMRQSRQCREDRRPALIGS